MTVHDQTVVRGPGLFDSAERGKRSGGVPRTVEEYESLLLTLTSRDRSFVDGPRGRARRGNELVHVERIPARPARPCGSSWRRRRK